jgi:hypothetical protein
VRLVGCRSWGVAGLRLGLRLLGGWCGSCARGEEGDEGQVLGEGEHVYDC